MRRVYTRGTGEPDVEAAKVLRQAGFPAAALDVLAGRRSIAWAVEHVKRSIPRRNEVGQALAREILPDLRRLAEEGRADG